MRGNEHSHPGPCKRGRRRVANSLEGAPGGQDFNEKRRDDKRKARQNDYYREVNERERRMRRVYAKKLSTGIDLPQLQGKMDIS